MKTISELVKNINPIECHGDCSSKINGIQYDSRKLDSGMMFVALRGYTVDGHDYIDKAIAAGATAIVCEELPRIINPNLVYIKVADTRSALAQLAHKWHGNPSGSMKVIGVTGTNGKTTITFVLKSIFEKAGYKTGIIGTTGIFIGKENVPATHTTPESLELAEIFAKMRDEDCQYVIMEVSSHALIQHRADCIDFTAAMFTNLTHDHLDFHKTMDEYAAAKRQLFEKLSPDSIAIVNCDDPYHKCIWQTSSARRKLTVGRADCDFRITNEELRIDKSEFSLGYNSINHDVSTKLIGRFNIDNTAICAAMALELGLREQTVFDAIAETDGAPGRMQRIPLGNGAAGIVDYAHTPDALEKALKSCRDVIFGSGKNGSRLICVFGCGGDRDATKRPVMGRLASELADYSVITDDNPRSEDSSTIINQILSGIPSELLHKTKSIADRAIAIAHAIQISKAGDLILIAGKGHENYQIIGKSKIHFDDVEELAKANNEFI